MLVTFVNGELRSIIEDAVDSPALYEQTGCLPERFSEIEMVREGSLVGWWYVSFERLFTITQERKYQVWLSKLFRTRKEAIDAEVEWLKEHFLEIKPAEGGWKELCLE